MVQIDFSVILKVCASPTLFDKTHPCVNKAIIPAGKTDIGIHKYGLSKIIPIISAVIAIAVS